MGTAPPRAPDRSPAGRPPATLKHAPPPSAGAPVLVASWGAGPNDLGRSVARESAPMAPMSFLPDAGGRALVLDRVNERVQIVEQGRVVRSIA